MIVNKSQINTEEFKKIFVKKFNNFCSKLPILISYTLQPNGVVIYQHFDEEDPENKSKLFYFEYDYEEDVRKNIFLIKKKLLPYLPVMKQRVKREIEASGEDINTKISEGVISLDDVTSKGYYVYQEELWRIEKALIERDELFIRNLYDNGFYRYKMKSPITNFLEKLNNKEVGPAEAWDIFISKSEERPLDPTDDGDTAKESQNSNTQQ